MTPTDRLTLVCRCIGVTPTDRLLLVSRCISVTPTDRLLLVSLADVQRLSVYRVCSVYCHSVIYYYFTTSQGEKHIDLILKHGSSR